MTIDFDSQDFQNALKTRNVVLDFVQHNEPKKALEALSYIATNIALKDAPRWIQDINERLAIVEVFEKQHILSCKNLAYLMKIPTADGTPPLIWAIAQKAEALVLNMLQRGVSVTTEDSKGKSAFSYMQEHFGLPWIEKSLHECSYENKQEMLHSLIKAGNEALVLQTLSNERTSFFWGREECTLAAEHHMRNVVQVCIQRGLVLSCKLLTTCRASFDTATVNELIALIPINDNVLYTIRNLLAPESTEVTTAIALLQRIEALPAEQQPPKWEKHKDSKKRDSIFQERDTIFSEIFCGAAFHGHKIASLARGGSPIEMGATQKTALMWAADLEMVPTTLELLHGYGAYRPQHNGLSGLSYVVRNARATFLTALVRQWPWEDKEITCNLIIELLLNKKFTLATQLLEQLSICDSANFKWENHVYMAPPHFNTLIISAAIQSDYPGLDSLLQKEFSIFGEGADGRTPLECFAEKRLDHHITSFLSHYDTATVQQLERIEKIRGTQYVDTLLQELLKYPHHFADSIVFMLQSNRFSKAQEILSTAYTKTLSKDSWREETDRSTIYVELLKLGTPEAWSEAKKLEALGVTIYNFEALLKKLLPSQKETFITEFWDIQKEDTFALFCTIFENDTNQQIAELLLKKVRLSDTKPEWWKNANNRNTLFCLACQKKCEAVCDYLCRDHDNEPYMTIPTSPPGYGGWSSCPLYNAIDAGYKRCVLLLIRHGASVFLRTSSIDDYDDDKTLIEHIKEKFGLDCVSEIAALYPLSHSSVKELGSLNYRSKEWNFGHLLLERIQQLNPSWWNKSAKTTLFFDMLIRIQRQRNNECYLSDLLILASECGIDHFRNHTNCSIDPFQTAIENNFLELVFVLIQNGARLLRAHNNKTYSVFHALEKCINVENPQSIQQKDIFALIDEISFEEHPESIDLITMHIEERSYDIAKKIYKRISSQSQQPSWWNDTIKMKLFFALIATEDKSPVTQELLQQLVILEKPATFSAFYSILWSLHFDDGIIFMLRNNQFALAQKFIEQILGHMGKNSQYSMRIFLELVYLDTDQARALAKKIAAFGLSPFEAFTSIIQNQQLSLQQKEFFITDLWDIAREETYGLFGWCIKANRAYADLLLKKIRLSDVKPLWWNDSFNRAQLFCLACQNQYEVLCDYLSKNHDNEPYMEMVLSSKQNVSPEHDPLLCAINAGYKASVLALIRNGALPFYYDTETKKYAFELIQEKFSIDYVSEASFSKSSLKELCNNCKTAKFKTLIGQVITKLQETKPSWWNLQTKMTTLFLLLQNKNDISDMAGPLVPVMYEIETATTQNDRTEFLRTSCDINLNHFASSESTIAIPTKNSAVDIESLHAFFQSHLTLTEEQLSSLRTFETRVKNKTPYLGTPTAEHQDQLHAFYKTIDDATCLVIETLNTLVQTLQQANQNKSLTTLQEEGNCVATELYNSISTCALHYIQAALLCGPAIYMNAIDEYRTVVLKKKPKTFQEHLKSLLAESRSIMVSELFNTDEQSLHAYTLFVQRYGTQLGLPLTNVIASLNDIFTQQHETQVRAAREQFFTTYTPNALLETVSIELCERTLRDECLDYLKKNASPSADVFAYELIMHHLRDIFATSSPSQKAEKVDAFLQKKSLTIMDTSSLEIISGELRAIMQSGPKALFLAQIQELDSNNKLRFTFPTLLSILVDANILQVN